MPETDAAGLAADIATLRDLLQGISFHDAEGSGAEYVRAALAARGAQLSVITEVAEAVATAVDQRSTLLTNRDAAMPSPEEIAEAEKAVLDATAAAAAGTGSTEEVNRASSRLADLLARKRAAEKDFNDGQSAAAQSLDGATGKLPEPGLPWTSVLSPLAGMLSGMGAAKPTPAQFAGSPVGAGQVPAAAFPDAGYESDKDRINDLMPSRGGDASIAGALRSGHEFTRTDQQGLTHTASDLGGQASALIGVQTSADVSGRPANPFMGQTGAPATAGIPAGGAPMMGAPMMPPMAPMGAAGGAEGNSGVASTGKKKTSFIINARDQDLAGDDIAAKIASSGVIGRDDNGH